MKPDPWDWIRQKSRATRATCVLRAGSVRRFRPKEWSKGGCGVFSSFSVLITSLPAGSSSTLATRFDGFLIVRSDPNTLLHGAGSKSVLGERR